MAEQARRNEFKDVTDYLSETGSLIWRFEHVGDKIIGRVENARRVDTVIGEKARRDPKGKQKRHLQLLVIDDSEQEWVLDFLSVNAKEALRKGLEDAGIGGLAQGDTIEMEYTHDDEPLAEGLTAARGYAVKVTP